jgi:RHS repeat-associated protein
MTDVYDRFENHTEFVYGTGGPADRLQSVTDPYGLTTTYAYGAGGRLRSVTDFAGRTTSFGWAGSSLVVTEPYAGSGQSGHALWSFALGADGLLRRINDPQFHTTVVTYDHYRVDRVFNAVESEIENSWRLAAMNVLALPVGGFGFMQLASNVQAGYADGNGNVWTYTTDAYGYLTSRTNPAPFQDTWTWTRNENGLPTEYVQPAGGGGIDALPALTTTYQYDAKGNLVLVLYPDYSTEYRRYDDHFSQVEYYTLTDPDDGTVREMTYDLDSRGAVVTATERSSRTTRYVYTPAPGQYGDLPGGLVVATTEAYGSADAVTTLTQYWRAGAWLGLPAVVTQAWGTSVAASVKSTYDAFRNPRRVRDELNRETVYTYDALDRLVRTQEPAPGTGDHGAPFTNYFYYPIGQARAVVDARGNATRYELDAMNRVTTTIAPNPGTGQHGAPVTVETFDGNGNLSTVTNPRGYTTTFFYDSRNLQTLIRQPGTAQHGTPVTTYFYDALGEVKEILDPLRNAGAAASWNGRMSYDELGRQRLLAEPTSQAHEAPTTATGYYADGLVKSVAAPVPAQSGDANYDYVYDSLRRLVEEILPEDNQGNRASRHYGYDLRDNLVQSIDARGYSTYYEYDERDRLVKMIQPDPNGGAALETIYSYNPAGELLAVTDPLGRTSVNTFDNLGRLVQVTLPDPDGAGPETSPRTRYRYDAVGNVVREEDALGHATAYAFDNLDRQISVTDANGDTTYYAYDENGNTVALTDPVGNTTAWVYDALDRPVSETNELGDARHFWYDQVGNLRKGVDRLGRVVEYDYDALYRRIKEEWRDYDGGPVVRTIQYTHYESGDLASVQDPDYGYNYLYDDLGRVLTVVHTPYTGVSFSPVTWNMYDAEGNRTDFGLSLISGPDDFTNHYTFDSLGRVTSIEQSGNFAAEKRVDFTYDRAGRWDTITRYADLNATQFVAASDYTFDAAGRLRNLTYSQNSTVLADYHWDYDVADRMTLFYSLRDGTATYTHDNRNQLTDASYTYQDPEDYEYDENGNRIDDGFTVGYNNRLTSDGTYTYQYDAEGNRTAKFIDNDGNWALSAGDTDVTQYTWDHRNRLVGIAFRDVQEGPTTKEIEYVYDPFNRLIGRKLDPDGGFGSAAVEETYFVYDGTQIVAQLDGPSQDDITNRYLWGPAVDQLLADEQVIDPTQPGQVVWPFIDHLNTIRDLAVLDTKGTPDASDDVTVVVTHRVLESFGLRTDQQQFDLAGAPIAPTDLAAVDCVFNYTGRLVETVSGLQQHGKRWYDFFTRTWLSEDWIVTADANVYRYVTNQPLVMHDPDGLYGKDVHFYFTYALAAYLGVTRQQSDLAVWESQAAGECNRSPAGKPEKPGKMG